jgi:hypothetical protein
MKHIRLRILPDPLSGPNTPDNVIAWADVIRQCIRRPLDPQKGVDVEEMRRGIRVLDAVDACQTETLELEDADWEHLVAKVKAMQWAIVDRRILLFIDDVMSAGEPVSPNGQVSTQEAHV